MSFLRLSILLLAATTAPSSGQTPDALTVREPSSQVAFPVRLAPPGGATTHELTGVAIRTKTIFRLKVYAFGLYVDADAAGKALGRYRDTPPERLAGDEGFYRRLLELDIPMTLRLVMTRDVGGKAVANSFDDALTPRVRRAATELGLAGGEHALTTFRGFFNLEEVAKGTEIVFSCDADGRLTTSVGDVSRPTVTSRALCWALFDVYLGEKPVSRDARANLVARFADVLASGRAPAPVGVFD
jgi:hypothetical protein